MAEISRLLSLIAALWEWQLSSACKTLPTEMFFHPDGERGSRRHKRDNAAKSVCASCPVIQQCRDQALSVHEPYGVWGGLTEDERLLILENKLDRKIPHAS